MDDATVIAKIKSDLTWIKQHERLLLVALGGIVLWFVIGKVDTLIVNHDSANLAQVKVTADAQAKANATLAAQIDKDATDRKALEAQLSAQNDKLEQATLTLANALAKQQKTDATLPPTELVQRLNQLVPNAASTVTPTGIALPQAGAVAVVQQLEEVPVLSSQLANTRTENENNKKLISADDASISLLNSRILGLDSQIVDNDKVCKAEVALVKAEARKGKRKWFLIGYVAGFLSRQAIKSYLGV
jgi:hypothetical protein